LEKNFVHPHQAVPVLGIRLLDTVLDLQDSRLLRLAHNQLSWTHQNHGPRPICFFIALLSIILYYISPYLSIADQMRIANNTYQLNVSLGGAEASARLRNFRTEQCVTLVHDRTLQNNTVTEEDLVQIFHAVSEMPDLRKFRVDFVGRPLRLPITSLAKVVRESKQLIRLVLEDVRLAAASADELEAAAQAIRQHPALEIVDLHCCVPADGADASLDPLVTALAHVPTLTEVLLRGSRVAPRNIEPQSNQNNNNNGDHDDDDSDSDVEMTDENTWSAASLKALCESPSLQRLTLRDMTEVQDQHIERMAEALRSNESLREFTICTPNLGERSGRAMGRVLQANRRLHKLEIQLNSGEAAIPITEILQANCSLKRLDLFFNGFISPRIREAFTEMLRRNYRLLDLNGSVWRGQSNLEIDFYLRLNRAGRGDLLTEHSSRSQWVDTLISQRDDLSIVFSLLSMNPSLLLPDEFKDVNTPGGTCGTSLHLRKRRKGEADEPNNANK